MGIDGCDENGKRVVEDACAKTQALDDDDDDNAASSPSRFGGRSMDRHTDFNDTIQLHEDLLFDTELEEEDAYVEAETQVVEDQGCIGHELGGETQLLEDSDCAAKEFEQEFSVNSDTEGTEKTDVLSDADGVSDDGTTHCKVNDINCENATADRVKKAEKERYTPYLHYPCGKDFPVDSDASTGDECIPGSEERSFTIGHKKSLQSFGLAAALSIPTGTAVEPNNTLSKSESGQKQENVKVQNLATDKNDDGVASLIHPTSHEQDQDHAANKFHRMGNKRAKKLFNDCTPALTMNKIDCPTERKDLPQLLVSTHDIAGLSYAGSQEPGEQTQANAWDIVDKFLSTNDVELSGELCPGVDPYGKIPHTSSAKGAQTLAKRSALRSPVNTKEIFDWIDSHEDEGGGEFFSNRKDALLGSGHHLVKSHTQSQKEKHVDFNRTGDAVNGLREKEEGIISGIGLKIIGSTHYDSTPILHSSMRGNEVQFSGLKAKKNLLKEMDEKTDAEVSGQQVEEPASPGGAYDVGFDTQLAAEAMEELFCGLPAAPDLMDVDPVAKGSTVGSSRGATDIKAQGRVPSRKKSCSVSDSEETSKKLNQMKRSKVSRKCPNSFGKKSRKSQMKNSGKECVVKSNLKRAKKFKEHQTAVESPNCDERIAEKASYSHKRRKTGGFRYFSHTKVDKVASDEHASIDKLLVQGHFHGTFSPVASRTRQCKKMNLLEKTEVSKSLQMEESTVESKKRGRGPIHFPKGRRSCRNMSNHASNLGISTDVAPEVTARSSAWQKLYKTDAVLSSMSGDMVKRKTTLAGKTMSPSLHLDILQKPGDAASFLPVNGTKNVKDSPSGPHEADMRSSISDMNTLAGKTMSPSLHLDILQKPGDAASFLPVNGTKNVKDSPSGPHEADMRSSISDMNEKTPLRNPMPSTSGAPTHSAWRYGITDSDKGIENAEGNDVLEGLPKRKAQSLQSSSIIPLKDTLAASPICEGHDCQKQSGRKVLPRPSLARELIRLNAHEAGRVHFLKDMRKRRDMASVAVLFSHHLGEDIIRQQKKILARLGASIASSSWDATHFIADKFVRTRNMLEAMAFGKPVVTHLWLESCGQASCFIDEKNYILRDTKKEKEIGFNMPASLARACHSPLLQGRRVFITPNVKPSRELIANLVMAVQGQAMERVVRSTMKDDKIPEDLLIISCEEDYAVCVPFLEKGAQICSSEFLLNGIVVQKLEYERHQLFVDHVKRTRSTIWLRNQEDKQFTPVTRPP